MMTLQGCKRDHLGFPGACRTARPGIFHKPRASLRSVTPGHARRVSTLSSLAALDGGFVVCSESAWASASLHPFAPRALPRFHATMGALTPARLPSRPAGLPAYVENLPTLPSPTTPGLPDCRVWVLALGLHRVNRQASSPVRHPSREVIGVTWASPFPSRLATATGRIEFTCVTDESFASGCSPPRLTATQLPSATRSQTSSRRGLAPR